MRIDLNLRVAVASAAVLLFAVPRPAAADDDRGRSLFAEHCASCHGDRGQGESSIYAEPLRGDASIGELSALIADTMPEGEPELVTGEDADAIATFIHAEFYGTAAQARSRPVRASFSRLTGDQLRCSIADLYIGMGSDLRWSQARGIGGEYFQNARWKKDQYRTERLDGPIDFDWGHDSPAEGIEPDQFRVVWRGSLMAPRTGTYEIIVRSTCSFTLDFERRGQRLIDNHTQSGDKTEFRRTVPMVAGRPYYFDLEMTQRDRKTEQPPAKIRVAWIPPHGVEQTIPRRYFLSESSAELYTLRTRLPPDDRSYGYSRGTSVDRSWDESVTAAALEFGPAIAGRPYDDFRRWAERQKIDDIDRAVLRHYLEKFLRLAFRGEIDDAIAGHYIDMNLAAAPDDAVAIRRTVLMALKSPRFLYPSLDPHQSLSRRRLNRMTLTLFDSLPVDDRSIRQADKDQFDRPEAVRGLASQMVKDPRCRAKFRDFIYHWMELGDVTELVKDAEQFAGFDAALVEDLRTSLDTFIDRVVFSGPGDYRQLVAADWTITGGAMPAFYGEAFRPAADRDDFTPTLAHPDQHVGVLTHPLLMARLAYHGGTSPIHRGVYLTRHVMGRVLRPPNQAFTPIDPQLHPDMTTRQRVQLQTGEVNCQVCHVKINGLGFALENFDAVGRFRETEVGQPIDASGRYMATDGTEVSFRGARELGDYVATSPDAHAAFIEALFEYFVKQPPAAYGPAVADQLLEHFRKHEFNIRELLIQIAILTADSPPTPDNFAAATPEETNRS